MAALATLHLYMLLHNIERVSFSDLCVCNGKCNVIKSCVLVVINTWLYFVNPIFTAILVEVYIDGSILCSRDYIPFSYAKQ